MLQFRAENEVLFDEHSFISLSYLISLNTIFQYLCSNFTISYYHQFLTPISLQLKISIVIIHEQQQKSVTIFQKQGLIMDCSASDIKDLKFGI